jgi:hypothetical protein
LTTGNWPLVVISNTGPATSVFVQLYDEGSSPTCSGSDVIFGDGSTITIGDAQTIVLWAGVNNGLAYKITGGSLSNNLVLGW